MNQEIERFAAWRDAVHLELLNAAVQLVISAATNAENTKDLKRHLRSQPWYESVDAAAFFAPTGLRYMGELLERYREKYGEERKHYRAVALALAIALPCVEDSMFVGSQRRDFMKQLQRDVEDDLYLQCAMYLLDPAGQKERYERIVRQTHADAAALLFSLWFLPKEAFGRLNSELSRLLVKEHKLPVHGNSGMYAAFLYQCGDEIKANRAKDFAPLKALMALSSGYVRSGSKQDVLLQSCGYTRQEIVYLNATLQWERSLPNTLVLDGIVAEKMAMEYAELTLNAPTVPHEQQLVFMFNLLVKYRTFQIKIEGKDTLWAAVKDNLHPCCPQIVAWMATHISDRFEYAFDVLDPNWDILTSLLSGDKYHELFCQQLVREKPKGATHLLSMLEQYEKLTGTHYAASFDQFEWDEKKAFQALADVGIIKLPAYFEKHQTERDDRYNHYSCLHYIIQYAASVPSRPAFEFWQWFFANHTVRDFPKFFGRAQSFDSELVKTHFSYYSHLSGYTLDLERTFLEPHEQRQLYEWIDESFFCFHPDQYASFQVYSLSHSVVCSLYTPEERRETFSMLLKTHPSVVSESLKRVYYTEDEKQRAAEAEELRKKQARLQDIENAKAAWKEKINEKYDGTIASAVKITDYVWRDENLLAEQLYPIIMEKLQNSEYKLPRGEMAALLILCGFFFKHLPMRWEQIRSILDQMQEVNANDSSTAASNDRDA